MQLIQGLPRTRRQPFSGTKKCALHMTFRLGVASLLLAVAMSSTERAEGQSELTSMPSSETNVYLPSLSAAPTGATQTIKHPIEQAQPSGSLLFNVFRSESADVVLPPQSPGQKLSRGLLDSVAPSAFIFTAAEAGISQAGKKYPAFRQGAAGYGRYYWHDFADQASQKLLVESFLPIVFHDDNRYYRLGHGSFVHRTGYALSRLVVTRSDRGQNVVNLPEMIGTGAAAGISSSYYPHQYNTWTETGQRWAFNAALDGGIMVVREFWPEFSHTVLRIHR
jgi:hypothetical protein